MIANLSGCADVIPNPHIGDVASEILIGLRAPTNPKLIGIGFNIGRSLRVAGIQGELLPARGGAAIEIHAHRGAAMHQSDMAPVIECGGEPGVHPASAVAASAISLQCKGNGAIGKAGQLIRPFLVDDDAATIASSS